MEHNSKIQSNTQVALKRLSSALSSGVAIPLSRRGIANRDYIPGSGVGGPLHTPYFANIMRLHSARIIKFARKRMQSEGGGMLVIFGMLSNWF